MLVSATLMLCHLGFNWREGRSGEVSHGAFSQCWDPVYLQISRNYLCVLANHPAIIGEALPMPNLASSPCLSCAHLMRRPFPGCSAERSCTHDTQHSGLLSFVPFPYWRSWLDPVLLGLGGWRVTGSWEGTLDLRSRAP